MYDLWTNKPIGWIFPMYAFETWIRKFIQKMKIVCNNISKTKNKINEIKNKLISGIYYWQLRITIQRIPTDLKQHSKMLKYIYVLNIKITYQKYLHYHKKETIRHHNNIFSQKSRKNSIEFCFIVIVLL